MARRKCRARSPKLFHKHLELQAPHCEAPCLRPPGGFARPKIVRSFHVADESPRDVSIRVGRSVSGNMCPGFATLPNVHSFARRDSALDAEDVDERALVHARAEPWICVQGSSGTAAQGTLRSVPDSTHRSRRPSPKPRFHPTSQTGGARAGREGASEVSYSMNQPLHPWRSPQLATSTIRVAVERSHHRCHHLVAEEEAANPVEKGKTRAPGFHAAARADGKERDPACPSYVHAFYKGFRLQSQRVSHWLWGHGGRSSRARCSRTSETFAPSSRGGRG